MNDVIDVCFMMVLLKSRFNSNFKFVVLGELNASFESRTFDAFLLYEWIIREDYNSFIYCLINCMHWLYIVYRFEIEP